MGVPMAPRPMKPMEVGRSLLSAKDIVVLLVKTAKIASVCDVPCFSKFLFFPTPSQHHDHSNPYENTSQQPRCNNSPVHAGKGPHYRGFGVVVYIDGRRCRCSRFHPLRGMTSTVGYGMWGMAAGEGGGGGWGNIGHATAPGRRAGSKKC